MRKLVCILFIALMLPFSALAAERLVLNGPMVQGALLMGRTIPGTDLQLSGKSVSVSPEGLFVIGFGRDAPKRWELSAVYPDGMRETRQLDIAPRAYDIQKIDGLPEKMVTPPKDVIDRIRAENEEVAASRQHNTPETWFANGFAWPATWMSMARRALSLEEQHGYLWPYDSWANRVAVHQFVQDIPMTPRHPTWATLQAVEQGLAGLREKPAMIVWGGRDFCFYDFFRTCG